MWYIIYWKYINGWIRWNYYRLNWIFLRDFCWLSGSVPWCLCDHRAVHWNAWSKQNKIEKCITQLLDVVSLTTIGCILLGFGRILVIFYNEKVFIVFPKLLFNKNFFKLLNIEKCYIVDIRHLLKKQILK